MCVCPEGFEETEDACVQIAEGGEWQNAGHGMPCSAQGWDYPGTEYEINRVAQGTQDR